MSFETVIGLEVHVELSTKSKIFCSCPTDFGAAPNTQVCEVCLGMPGILPQLNKKAVEYAIKTGLATNCHITGTTRFDRKNYFYPDLPKGYQISQLYCPVCTDGFVEINNGKKIRIHEIHMEEDAGKLIHTDDDMTLIDFNRCGVPLLEIVTEPDFGNADEVIEFLSKLRGILTYIGVSDCKMQEGSMRADVNLSVKPAGSSTLGTRTETKNLNSFHDIANMIENESARQIKLLENGGKVMRETRRWDAEKRTSFAMRSKEAINDYKYFPEPDIPAIIISDTQIEEIRKALPELPDAKKERYINSFGLSSYDASVITADRSIAEFYEELITMCDSPKEAANWVTGEVLRLLNDSSTPPESNPLKAKALASIIEMVMSGRINRRTGKAVLEKAFYDGIEPKQYVAENSLSLITDYGQIKAAVSRVLSENEKSVSDYKGGKQTALTYLIGQSMKELGGKAPAQDISKALKELLD